MQYKRAGFSLVELSIVLVILGLLTGGILGGQNLMRAAELRSISNDAQRFITATATFKDKYFALPGDMPNATKFWTASNPTPATCYVTASTNGSTCDGNGDGMVDQIGGTFAERHNFWVHLANAGLIEGTYAGRGNVTPGDSTYLGGYNVPKLKLGQGCVQISHSGTFTGNPVYYDGHYGNMIWIAKCPSHVDYQNYLTTEEAWNLDTKMDDGKPGQGSVVTTKSTHNVGCSTTDVVSTSEYNLSITGSTCHLMVKTGF